MFMKCQWTKVTRYSERMREIERESAPAVMRFHNSFYNTGNMQRI